MKYEWLWRSQNSEPNVQSQFENRKKQQVVVIDFEIYKNKFKMMT